MKIKELLQTLTTQIASTLTGAQSKFQKACTYTLQDALRKYKQDEVITPKIASEIINDYQSRLKILIENGKNRASGQKVHWVSEEAAKGASSVLNILLEKELRTAASKPSSKPQESRKVHDQKPETKSETKSDSKSVNDNTKFAEYDSSYPAGSSEEDIGIINIAANCCSFPSLVLHLQKKHNIKFNIAIDAVNKITNEKLSRGDSPPKFLTVNEVIPVCRALESKPSAGASSGAKLK